MNKVTLIGRLTKDPEMRQIATTGSVVSSFSLAVNRRFTKQGEERQADFFNIVAWGKTAEFCNKYFKKGQQVAIAGRLQNRNWDDQEGKKHYITEIVAEEAYFADSRKDSYGGDTSFDPTFGAAPSEEVPEVEAAPIDTSDFETTSGNDLPF